MSPTFFWKSLLLLFVLLSEATGSPRILSVYEPGTFPRTSGKNEYTIASRFLALKVEGVFPGERLTVFADEHVFLDAKIATGTTMEFVVRRRLPAGSKYTIYVKGNSVAPDKVSVFRPANGAAPTRDECTRCADNDVDCPCTDPIGKGEIEFLHCFTAPAQFLPPDSCGGVGPLQGAVIYEGMQVRLRGNGTFDVAFRASTPAMPVSLFLQLELDLLHDQGLGGIQTITLPPILLDPIGRTDFGLEQAGWKVKINEITPALSAPNDHSRRDWKVCLTGCHCGILEAFWKIIDVRRLGIARFGSRPREEPF